MAMDDANSRPA